MAFSRRLGVIWIAGASWLVAVGCDDSEDQSPPPAGAGEAGEAPGGGKSSVAGSQNNGGKAGASAGSAGKAGMSSGGINAGGAGAGGETSAGQAGVGGEIAGAAGGGGIGGATGGQGGAGGEGGSAGEGGTIPAIVVPHCSFTCTSDDDCLLDGGDDDSQKCNPVRHVCEDPTLACSNDQDCLISMSAWEAPCANDSECAANTEACVQANGQGYCATLPGASDTCANTAVAKMLTRFGAAGTVKVCASADPRCFGNRCRPGCSAPNKGCGLGLGDTCNTATGLCQCKTGAECEKTGVCGPDKHCDTCKTTEDCASTITDLACNQGHCGCGDPDECIDLGYANATAQCQLL
jgi:hypothetical protein